MENFKNEFCSEMIRAGFSPEDTVRALKALAVTLNGYNITPKEANIVVYDGVESSQRLIKLYRDCKIVEGCSKDYCKNLLYLLPMLFDYLGKDAKEISSMDVRAFLAYYKTTRNVSDSTLDRVRRDINGFFAWLVNEQYITRNPCSSIKDIKAVHKERESLSRLELEEIRLGVRDEKERMVIEVLYGTACRVSELVRIKLTDIDWTKEHPTIKLYGKGKKERVIALPPKANLAVKAYLNNRKSNSEYLLVGERDFHRAVSTNTVRNIIKHIEARLSKDIIRHHLHPHLMRHTAATIAVNGGMPIQEVQVMLGHTKIETTTRYAHVDKRQVYNDQIRYIS